jgi:hypothetical protein
MKRSKLFLGLTTACLAIAGIVAAKTSHFGHTTGYYFTNNNIVCVPGDSQAAYDPSGNLTARTLVQGIKTYYTALTALGVKCNSNKLTYFNS